MKKKELLGYELELYFLLEQYLKENLFEKNYFFQINEMNYQRLNYLIKLLDEKEKDFLLIYYSHFYSNKEKLDQLKMTKSQYYLFYNQIIRNLEVKIKDGNM